jgi:hypothetical protein
MVDQRFRIHRCTWRAGFADRRSGIDQFRHVRRSGIGQQAAVLKILKE